MRIGPTGHRKLGQMLVTLSYSGVASGHFGLTVRHFGVMWVYLAFTCSALGVTRIDLHAIWSYLAPLWIHFGVSRGSLGSHLVSLGGPLGVPWGSTGVTLDPKGYLKQHLRGD